MHERMRKSERERVCVRETKGKIEQQESNLLNKVAPTRPFALTCVFEILGKSEQERHKEIERERENQCSSLAPTLYTYIYHLRHLRPTPFYHLLLVLVSSHPF